MSTLKEKLDTKIGAMLANQDSPRAIVRRLIFFDMSAIFSNDEERGFSILNEVSKQFYVPLSSVRVVGSGQFGYSYFSRRDFTPKTSDLDLAIVSPFLFQKYAEHCYSMTERYTNLVGFDRRKGINTATQFREYLSAGYFRPDLMPKSPKKEEWFSFFDQLSNKHIDLFEKINAGIYLSETFLEIRNVNLVSEYRKANQ